MNNVNVQQKCGTWNNFEGIKREKHRCIYASSYNRGLEELLGMWPDVRKEVPDATLHVYYGWETYDAFVKQGHTRDDGFKAKMEALMKQDGVFHHGRIGHKELLKEYARSEVLAYPCSYKGEINCIALTKAIATGCIPVTNDFAVMKERNIYGSVPQANFKEHLINVLKNGSPKIDSDKYIQRNSWASVAQDWSERLFSFDNPVVYSERLDWIRSNIDKKSKIIDIGCNKGHLFYGWDRTNITSLDIDEYDLPNFIRADATKPLPFNDKEFDIAVMGEIVEHTDNPSDVVREAMRISKKLIITVPWESRWTSKLLPFATIEERMKIDNVESRLELAKKGNPEAKNFNTDYNFEHLYHKQFFSADSMKKILNDAGIEKYHLVELRFNDWVNIGVVCG